MNYSRRMSISGDNDASKLKRFYILSTIQFENGNVVNKSKGVGMKY